MKLRLRNVDDDARHELHRIQLLFLDGLGFMGVVRKVMAGGSSLQRVGDLLGCLIIADALEADGRAHDVPREPFETSPVSAVNSDIVVNREAGVVPGMHHLDAVVIDEVFLLEKVQDLVSKD